MNLIPLHFILKDVGTTVCKKFKILLKWQTNTWFWVQVGERCWVGQEEIPKAKNPLPDFFFFNFSPSECKMSAHIRILSTDDTKQVSCWAWYFRKQSPFKSVTTSLCFSNCVCCGAAWANAGSSLSFPLWSGSLQELAFLYLNCFFPVAGRSS